MPSLTSHTRPIELSEKILTVLEGENRFDILDALEIARVRLNFNPQLSLRLRPECAQDGSESAPATQ